MSSSRVRSSETESRMSPMSETPLTVVALDLRAIFRTSSSRILRSMSLIGFIALRPPRPLKNYVSIPGGDPVSTAFASTSHSRAPETRARQKRPTGPRYPDRSTFPSTSGAWPRCLPTARPCPPVSSTRTSISAPATPALRAPPMSASASPPPRKPEEAGAPGKGAGPPFPHPLEESPHIVGALPAAHPGENPRVDVLDGNVEVPAHLPSLPPHPVAQVVIQAAGVEVEQPHPPHSPNGADVPDEAGKPPFLSPVRPVGGDVLSDQVDLPRPPADQHSHFGEKGVPVAAPQRSADVRNRAIGATVVAPLQDLDERGGLPRLPKPVPVRLLGQDTRSHKGAGGTPLEHLPHQAGDRRDIAGPHEQVHFRQDPRQFVPLPLLHAPPPHPTPH